MSERKPFAVPFESWIDQQISGAQRRGDFDNLSGRGQPLPKRDTDDPAWWVKQKLAEEDLGMPLPPALELKAEVRRTLAAIGRLRTEAQVREALELLNAKIRKANRTTISGPPTDLSPVRVEGVVDRWKAERGLV